MEHEPQVKATAKGSRAGRSRAAALALVALMLGGLASISPAAPTESADAWPLSPTVTLQGRALCASSPATWVWVSGSNGEQGWATQPGGNYSFRFNRVPTSTMTVTVTYGNGTFRCRDTFGLNRPCCSSTATRNVIRIWPNA